MSSEQRTKLLCDVLHLIARAIVNDARSVSVVALPAVDGLTVIQVRVAPADVGRVIGRDGQLARALREYVRAFRLQQGGRYGIDLPLN